MDVVFVLRIYLNEYCFHAQEIYEWGNFQTPEAPPCTLFQGRIQDFKLGEAHLKKIAPSGGRRENVWGISCEKSRFYAKKNHIFSNFRGARAGCAPWIRPCILPKVIPQHPHSS